MTKLKKWLKELLIFVLLAMVILFIVDYWRQPKVEFNGQLDAMTLLQNKETVSLTTLSEERPLLIYFWATWCSICKITTPTALSMAEDGDNVLSVVIRSGDEQRLRQTIGNNLTQLPIVNDQTGQISADWDVSATPTFIILYKGKIAYSTTGWTSYLGLWVRMKLAELLA